ncbi:general secretion pathway protein GspN [Hylemonella gracilis str. Niagara R]|uniref:Type II secretion system protein N n=1 Tax=Hylemonella gracilis str. Niagara R TaxID=1458275 RepID=A0A016XGR8_9BURK|nr:type II secretion system protein N [Hylemonella gracilis]EYC51060.1 general secretion pathway protein GspN [Hylemonella gracilis str. Niagara R]
MNASSSAVPGAQAGGAWRAPLLGLSVGVLAGLLVFAPARWLAAGVGSLSAGRVTLSQAQGTVWAGQAGLSLSAGVGALDPRALPGGVRWRLGLGWGRDGDEVQGKSWFGQPVLRVEISAPCCSPEPLRLSVHDLFGAAPAVVLAAHSSQWPASWLAGLGAPWNTLALQGQLLVSTPGLRWQAQRMEGELEVQALRVSSALSTLKPLGSYRLHLSSSAPDSGGISRAYASTGSGPSLDNPAGAGTVHLVLSTLEGDLQLSAQGQWQAGRLRLQGLAEASPDRIDALSNLLNILGRRDGLRAHLRLG